MNFLVDNQLPLALAAFLRSRTHDAGHVIDISLSKSSDSVIWDYGWRHGIEVISKDEDFFHLANRADDGGRLLWIRIGNCRKDYLLRAVDAALPQIVAAFDQGARIVELR